MHGHYTDILWCTVTILIYYDARSLYWYTMMHGHYTDILRCTVTILIYYDARSLYWYTIMHGHYTDILWCTITILIYYDARSLYWYTVMHGQQNIKCATKFLEIKQSADYVEIVKELLFSYRAFGRNMSLKLQFLQSHLNLFSAKYGSRLRMENRYNGKWNTICWLLAAGRSYGRRQQKNLRHTRQQNEFLMLRLLSGRILYTIVDTIVMF
jgi:hypothetical protein